MSQKNEYGAYWHSVKVDSLKFPANGGAFSENEELVYEVTYMGIGLGTVRTKIIGIDSSNNGVTLSVEGYIKSYKGVPFVTLNTVFKSRMDKYCSSVGFAAKEALEDTTHKYIYYQYKPSRDSVYIKERIGKKDLVNRYDTLFLHGLRWQDGLSLLFYARAHAHHTFRDTVPVLMYKTKSKTYIDFGIEREEMEIDRVDYPIKTVKLEGESKFTGIFGLTGDFEGWFSDDYASVPIYAKMHVLLGSVRLELIRWKKKNWKPPRYRNN